MDSTRLTPLEEIKQCIKNKKGFVLQGGAGSGKTETLKRTLEFISERYPNKRVACITHTNLAAEEIASRVGDKYTISTIHSFLNEFIKNYKRNIHQVLFEIFKIEKIVPKGIEFYDNDEKERKKGEHENYKSIHDKYAKLLFKIKRENIERYVDKRTYDINPTHYNNQLNELIEKLNIEINYIIQEGDFKNIEYNNTKYDSLSRLTFGHDSLLTISSLLFSKHKILGKIINDKFDFVFIDEYQDTRKDIIDIFLKEIPDKRKTIIGLFGDSMQGIYDDGSGDVNEYIVEGSLKMIPKEDNYRCSEQVKDFINLFRNDGLKQEVAFKYIEKEKRYETIKERQGEAKLYYSIISDRTDKDLYLSNLKYLISEVEKKHVNYKKLMLTNKSISMEVGFLNLYEIFSNRYQEVKDEIEKLLSRLQYLDLAELYISYKSGNYNDVIVKVKKAGFNLKSFKDKQNLSHLFLDILNTDICANEALNLAFDSKIIEKTEAYQDYMLYKNNELETFAKDINYQNFKTLYNSGLTTYSKMKEKKSDLYEPEFNYYKNQIKKENFYIDFFSEKLNFKEIINYYRYLKAPENLNNIEDKIEYMTMHMTKGAGIENVIVVADEYFWTKYNFKSVFDTSRKNDKTLKLFYVACSRAKSNLVVIRLITEDEKDTMIKYFDNYEEIKFSC